MPGCVVEAYGPGFDSYHWLDTLDYSVLVVAYTVSTTGFGFREE